MVKIPSFVRFQSQPESASLVVELFLGLWPQRAFFKKSVHKLNIRIQMRFSTMSETQGCFVESPGYSVSAVNHRGFCWASRASQEAMSLPVHVGSWGFQGLSRSSMAGLRLLWMQAGSNLACPLQLALLSSSDPVWVSPIGFCPVQELIDFTHWVFQTAGWYCLVGGSEWTGISLAWVRLPELTILGWSNAI